MSLRLILPETQIHEQKNREDEDAVREKRDDSRIRTFVDFLSYDDPIVVERDYQQRDYECAKPNLRRARSL